MLPTFLYILKFTLCRLVSGQSPVRSISIATILSQPKGIGDFTSGSKVVTTISDLLDQKEVKYILSFSTALYVVSAVNQSGYSIHMSNCNNLQISSSNNSNHFLIGTFSPSLATGNSTILHTR